MVARTWGVGSGFSQQKSQPALSPWISLGPRCARPPWADIPPRGRRHAQWPTRGQPFFCFKPMVRTRHALTCKGPFQHVSDSGPGSTSRWYFTTGGAAKLERPGIPARSNLTLGGGQGPPSPSPHRTDKGPRSQVKPRHLGSKEVSPLHRSYPGPVSLPPASPWGGVRFSCSSPGNLGVWQGHRKRRDTATPANRRGARS